jgi:hypothetical protein
VRIGEKPLIAAESEDGVSVSIVGVEGRQAYRPAQRAASERHRGRED